MIPPKYDYDIIKYAHRGHIGRERTHINIIKHYKLRNVKAKIRKYIEACEKCTLQNGMLRNRTTIGKYPIPDFPFEKVGIDLLGPLSTTTKANKYVLGITDYLTRYLVAVPIPNKESTTIINALRIHVYSKYNCPKIIISDNAGEFSSTLFKNAAEAYGVHLQKTGSYHPQSNGLIERFNAKIVRGLKTYLAETDNTEWDELLPEVTTLINSTYYTNIEENPAYALLGFDRQYPIRWQEDTEHPPIYNYEDYFRIQAERMKQLRNHIQHTLSSNVDEYLKAANKKLRPRSLQPGQRCYIKHVLRPDEQAKLAPKFDGPCVVISQESSNRYNVMDLSTKKIKECHIDNILAKNVIEDLTKLISNTDIGKTHNKHVETKNNGEHSRQTRRTAPNRIHTHLD